MELKSIANRLINTGRFEIAAAPRALWLLVIFTLFIPGAQATPTGDVPAPYTCWLESGLSSLFDQVSPSVVRVVSHRRQQPTVAEGLSSKPRYHCLIASGVVVGPLGSVVTSARVAQPGDSIIVHFPDGTTLNAAYRGVDPLLNIVVLSLISEDGSFPYLVHNNATGPDLPEWVAAVAYGPTAGALKGKPTLTLSTRESIENVRTQYGDSLGTVWRIRAPFYPGNAGGALVGLDGEWLGLITGVISGGTVRDRAADRSGGISLQAGVIVPAGIIAAAINDIVTGNRETTGFLGVGTYQADEDDRSDKAGVLVTEVLTHSPAAIAGVRAGDRIIRFNNHLIDKPSKLTEVLNITEPGKVVRLEVNRNDKPRTLILHLGDSNAANLYLNLQRQQTNERLTLKREIVRLEKQVLLLRSRLSKYGSAGHSCLRSENQDKDR